MKATTKLLQQFHDQIQNVYPSYKKFFHEVECRTSLAFYEQYPSPVSLAGVNDEKLAEFLRVPSHNVKETTSMPETVLSRVS